MSVAISISHAKKEYENHNVVIPDLSLEIPEGQFFTLLGPSGCGKTTLLRMIAGFNSIEGGEFRFNDKVINNLDPAKRNIGMVFQNYAIFPHMTVRQNVEFGLNNRKLPAAEVKERADRFLKLMQIDQFQDRKPDKLSGGQQQRVALARALSIEPDVLLMDEPLSNLDAKLRLEMRNIIRSIQKQVGITTVYVTHDQEEAMAVSDRIAVMNLGVIQQIGTPKDLYHHPANRFVATFIGHTNMLKGSLTAGKEGGKVRFGNGYTVEGPDFMAEDRESVLISVRPEEFVLHTENPGEGLVGTIESSTFLGLNTEYFVTLETGEKVEIIRESSYADDFRDGSRIWLTVKKEKISIFTDDDAARSLMTWHASGEEA